MRPESEAEERERQLTALQKVRPAGARPARAELLHTALSGELPVQRLETLAELRAVPRRDYASPVISLSLTLESAKAVRKPPSPR
jgi:hypothetical protein